MKEKPEKINLELDANQVKELIGEKKTQFKQIIREYYLFGKLLILSRKEFVEYKDKEKK